MKSDTHRHRIIPRRTAIRWAILMLPLLAVVVAILMNLVAGDFFGLRQLAQSSPTLGAARMLTVVQVVFGTMTAIAIAIGSYVIWYAYRALQCGVFPPPGAWMIEGGSVQTGKKARAIAWFQIVLGVVLIAAGCGAIYYAWAILPEFLRTGEIALSASTS